MMPSPSTEVDPELEMALADAESIFVDAQVAGATTWGTPNGDSPRTRRRNRGSRRVRPQSRMVSASAPPPPDLVSTVELDER